MVDGVASRRDPGTPVLGPTGRADEIDRLRGFAAGADDYVPKPFTPRELHARIAAHLRRAGTA